MVITIIIIFIIIYLYLYTIDFFIPVAFNEDQEIDNRDINSFNIFNYFYKIPSSIKTKEKSSFDEMFITETMKLNFEKILLNKELENQKEKINNGYCFDENGNMVTKSKEECIDIYTWDYPVNNSKECAYYKSNKNYLNDFGKLINNNCELPSNMKLIGYRHFSKDPQFLPLCYNCEPNKRLFVNKTLGLCCYDQKDKLKYPNLITPDYAFKDDEEIRNVYKEQLNLLGLSSK